MKYVYVHSIDEANDTVYVDYNHKMAGLAFDYQITLLKSARPHKAAFFFLLLIDIVVSVVPIVSIVLLILAL